MSNVKAFRCDYCGEIKTEESIVGISPMQDILEQLKSFPIIKNPDKATIHGCTDCYNHCMSEANTINRKRYEELYIQKREESGYSFRKQCVYNSLNKQYTPPKVIAYKSLFL